MLKKISKGLVLSLMCTFLLASTVCAKEAYYLLYGEVEQDMEPWHMRKAMQAL